ncbi:MAG: hypothetical protein ACRDLL_04430 [Solirubrobacterales bacterium]
MTKHRKGTKKALSREEYWERCSELGSREDILAQVDADLRRTGFAGDTVNVLIVYLATVTRLFNEPVSVALLGPSSAGKSFTIKRALDFHPPEAYLALTAMSDKALIYMDVSLQHRMLVVYETAGLSGEFLAYGIRTLLSEGRLDYWFTDFELKRAVNISQEGPTGLITSTAGSLDRELSTRVMQATVKDDAELTRAIMLAAAKEDQEEIDLSPYHDLQRWIAAGPREVWLPFSEKLARETDPTAVRLRRDFQALLGLTRSHALLHQANRDSDARGRIVAVPADYAAIHRLVAAMIAEGAERAVPDSVRETVSAVGKLDHKFDSSPHQVTIAELAKHLGINRSSASRRVNRALGYGFLKDVSGGGRGKPKLLERGDPMPEDAGVLPPPEILT